MTAEELRDIMAYLRDRVTLGPEEPDGAITIGFRVPTEGEMVDAGLDAEGSKRILSVAWWEEMVEDIVETPDMCDDDDSPQQVLEYAQDVVSEYIRKRFPLDGD
jgi:hypothetical protein